MTKEAVIQSVAKILDATSPEEEAQQIRNFIERGAGEITENNFYTLAEGLDFTDTSTLLLAARRASRHPRRNKLGVFEKITTGYIEEHYGE